MQNRDAPMSMDMKDYIFIDVETTGLNLHDSSSYFDNHISKKDLSQIGLAFEDELGKVQTMHSYVKPPEEYFEHKDKWYKVGEKFNVSADDVKNAPRWSSLFPMVRQAVGNRIPVAHNANFDAQVLMDTSMEYGLRFIERPFWKCTRDDARELMKRETDKFGLKDLTMVLGLPDFQHHDATADAVACMNVFKSLLHYRKRPDWIFV